VDFNAIGIAGFGTPSEFDVATGDGNGAIAIADFNGDGKPDIAVAGGGDAELGSVSVFLNATAIGSAVVSFGSAVSFVTDTNSATAFSDAIAVADFNGDGRPDVAVVTGIALVVLLNETGSRQTAASFGPTTFIDTDVATKALLLDVAAADVNGDGLPDSWPASAAGRSGCGSIPPPLDQPLRRSHVRGATALVIASR
jgi:hypothetical protein